MEKVDTALGLIRHPDKNECASNDPDRVRKTMEGLEDTTGFPKDHMHLLGIMHYCANKSTETHLTDDKKKTIFARLNKIRYVAKAKHMREKHVKSLVLPILTWCGAWCNHSKDTVKKVRSAVIKTVLRKQVAGARPFLTWVAALGPDLDPVYLMDLRIIGIMRWKIREALEKGSSSIRSTKRWRAMLHRFGWVEVGTHGPRRINTKTQSEERIGSEVREALSVDRPGTNPSTARALSDLGVVQADEGIVDVAAVGNATLKKVMRRVWAKVWWRGEKCLDSTI